LVSTIISTVCGIIGVILASFVHSEKAFEKVEKATDARGIWVVVSSRNIPIAGIGIVETWVRGITTIGIRIVSVVGIRSVIVAIVVAMVGIRSIIVTVVTIRRIALVVGLKSDIIVFVNG
jgi:hypothetical protein